MTVHLPEDLARELEGIAAAQHKTAEEVALDRLRLGGRPPIIPGCDQPGNAVVLWRYMNLEKFLSVLRDEELYFSRLIQFEDSWEGINPSALGLYPHLEREDLKRLYLQSGRAAAVSCWHEGCDESVAMWRLYTSGAGVAIKTTTRALMRSLQANGFRLRVARVRYVDDSKSQSWCPGEPHGLEPVYCKRSVYRHEREVRATLLPDGFPDDPQVERDPCCGFPISVELTTLINGVVVSEQSLVRIVEEALNRAGVSIRARLSAIYRGPRDLLLDQE